MKLRLVLCAGLAALLAACGDSNAVGPSGSGSSAKDLFARYVSLGTSVSMGVQGAGVYEGAQKAAWPAQLAAKVGVPFTLPLVQNPGCPPSLASPLAVDAAAAGVWGAVGGTGDIVDALGGVCAPNQPGVTLPAENVAISGANVHDALYTTPALAAQHSVGRGKMYSRVLLPGQTQVSAMAAEKPTFVSVELATNEILPANRGLISLITPYESWRAAYDSVLAAVKATGARAVLVGLPHDAANFPSVRSAKEFYTQGPYLLGLGILVGPECQNSPNYLFVPGYVLSLLAKAPTTATCADVPGQEDFVVTPADVAFINDRMAQMNAHMQGQAAANGWAYFDLSPVYDLPKIAFDMRSVLLSSQPFGPFISLDGVHPNDAGQAILAQAAANAIAATYHVALK